MSYDVFISSAHEDKQTADAACAMLEANGVKCWIAPRDIRPGQNFGEGIMGGINQARVMVLIFSSSANGSQHVQREVERALHRGLPIIPFRIENVAPAHGLDYFLSLPNWLDAFTPPVESHLSALVKAVRDLLQMPAQDRPSAPVVKPAQPKSEIRIQLPSAASVLGLLRSRWVGFGLGAIGLLALIVAVWPSAGPSQPGEPAAAAPRASETKVAEMAPAPEKPPVAPSPVDNDPELQRFNDALAKTPNDWGALFDRALTLHRRGQYDLAIRDYDQAISLKPADSTTFYNRGLSYDLKGDFARALKDYDEAIRLKPDHGWALSNRATIYKQQGDIDRALLDYNEALRLQPDDPVALGGRADAYYRRGQNDQALKDYTRVIQLKPTAENYVNRAAVYANMDDLDRAIADNDEAVRIQPDYTYAFDARCRYRALAKKQLEQALSDCNRAAQLSRATTAFKNRGIVYFRLERYADAIADFDEVLTRAPKAAEALFVRGLCKRRLGDTTAGDADVMAAKATDPQIATFLARFGVLP